MTGVQVYEGDGVRHPPGTSRNGKLFLNDREEIVVSGGKGAWFAKLHRRDGDHSTTPPNERYPVKEVSPICTNRRAAFAWAEERWSIAGWDEPAVYGSGGGLFDAKPGKSIKP